MNIINCRNCQHFMERRSDCMMCRFETEMYYRTTNRNYVISCPVRGK